MAGVLSVQRPAEKVAASFPNVLAVYIHPCHDLHMDTETTTTTTTTTKARCYREFCCNEATVDVTDYGQGKTGPFDPARPYYENRGRWGYCLQHAKGK